MEDTDRNGSLQGPDVTTSYTQANMLKMLKTAKDIVSSARVENSLDNATKTIENWTRRGPDGNKLILPTRLISTDSTHGRLPYVSGVTDNHAPFAHRSLSPTLPLHYSNNVTQTLHEKTRNLTRPTPLRYTLPARTNHHQIYGPTLPISSLSSPHIALRDPPPPTAPKPQHRLYLDGQACQKTSTFFPYREFQVPDIYVEHQDPLESRKLYSENQGHKKRSQSYVAPSPDTRRRNDYDEPSACLAELSANHLMENQHSHTTPCLGSHYQRPSASCINSYLEPDPDDVPLLGKEKLNRRASFLRATWAGDRMHHLNERSPTCTSSGSRRINAPDLFPRAVMTGPKPFAKNFCYNVPVQPEYLDLAHMCSYPYKPQRLRCPMSTRLPSYREALMQNTAALRRSSSTVVHRHYSDYLNSMRYDLPVYADPLAQMHYYDRPKEVCHVFPCANHCPNDMALIPRLDGRTGMYQDAAFGIYEGTGCSHQDLPVQTLHTFPASSRKSERRRVLVAHRGNSPYVPRPWGRVSSLESEV